jgi:hypothetical protein
LDDLEELKMKEERRRELTDIGTVLSNASGRRFVWRVLEKCGAFSSTFSKEQLTMAYLSGKQDLGHFIMSEIVASDENLLFKLMKENKTKDKEDE